jgi:hypothetical protein
MKLLLGGQVFRTKALAKDYVMEIAKKHVGEAIMPDDPDFSLFADLWTRSPAFVEGMDHFEIGRKFSGVSVRAVSREGESIDWSLRNAVSGHLPGVHTQLTLAMRLAIRPQIVTFRNGNRKCERCYSFEDIEIDHVVPFKELMQKFLSLNPHPQVFHYTASGWQFCREHAEYEKAWIEHHRKYCVLRPLCSGCHKEFTLASRRQERDSDSMEELVEGIESLQLGEGCEGRGTLLEQQ